MWEQKSVVNLEEVGKLKSCFSGYVVLEVVVSHCFTQDAALTEKSPDQQKILFPITSQVAVATSFFTFFLDFEIFTWNLSPEVPKGPRFTECSSYWSHFPCQLALAPLKLQETSDFFVSSCSSPGLFLLQLHFVEFSFPIFLHFSLLAEILPQLLWSHTFISSRLGWLAFGSHSSWPSLMGCVPLSLHPSHLHTKGENWKKKNNSENWIGITWINHLQSA